MESQRPHGELFSSRLMETYGVYFFSGLRRERGGHFAEMIVSQEFYFCESHIFGKGLPSTRNQDWN